MLPPAFLRRLLPLAVAFVLLSNSAHAQNESDLGADFDDEAAADFADEPIGDDLADEPAGDYAGDLDAADVTPEPVSDDGAELAPPQKALMDSVAGGVLSGDGEAAASGDEAQVGDVEMTKEEIAAALRSIVSDKREAIVGATQERVIDKQTDRLGTVLGVVFLVSLCGVFLFLVPLFLRRQLAMQRARAMTYGGSAGTGVWKYTSLAALLFFVSVNVFGLIFGVMRGSQILLGSLTNPQIQIATATFDLVDKKADEMAEAGPILLGPIAEALSGSEDVPVLTAVINNIQALSGDVSVFETVGSWFSGLDWLFGLVPMFLALIVLALFMRGVYPAFRDIVTLPIKATAGHASGRQVVGSTMRSVWSELRATGAMVLAMIALSMVASFFLIRLLAPAIEIFLTYLILAFLYVQTTATASSFWILFSLTASLLFLALNLVTIIAGSTLFLSRTHKIFVNRFRHSVPLKYNKVFFTWGLVRTLWLFVLPLLYILVALKGVEWVAAASIKTESWPLILGLGPALFVLGFIAVFWAGRGWRSLRWLLAYKPVVTAVQAAALSHARKPAAQQPLPPTMHVQPQPQWPVSMQPHQQPMMQPPAQPMMQPPAQPMMQPPAQPMMQPQNQQAMMQQQAMQQQAMQQQAMQQQAMQQQAMQQQAMQQQAMQQQAMQQQAMMQQQVLMQPHLTVPPAQQPTVVEPLERPMTEPPALPEQMAQPMRRPRGSEAPPPHPGQQVPVAPPDAEPHYPSAPQGFNPHDPFGLVSDPESSD